MKTELILKSLFLDNFAGSGTEEHSFNTKETSVSADNGIGKTRLLKGFTYLLFDKDQDDRKVFNIKNTINKERNRQDHVVGAVIEKNGSPISLKKIFREKWTKKQGTKTTVFDGHETEYFYDNVPVSKKDYEAKIDALIKEDIFKMLTNVGYFNALNPSKQRDIILGLVPALTDKDIAGTNPEYQRLLDSLKNEKTIAEYKIQISHQKSKLKENLKAIPIRIDQEMKGMPKTEDFPLLESELTSLKSKIEEVEKQLSDQASEYDKKNQAHLTKKNAISDLKLKLGEVENKIKFDANSAGNDLINKKRISRSNIENEEKNIKDLKEEGHKISEAITAKEKLRNDLRAEFDTVTASSYKKPEIATECLTCGHVLTPAELSEKHSALEQAFNTKKLEKLQEFNDIGPTFNTDITELGNQLRSIDELLTKSEEDLANFKNEFQALVASEGEPVDIRVKISSDPEYIKVLEEIKQAESLLLVVEPIDQSALKTQKSKLNEDIDSIKERLAKKTQIEAANTRIDGLKADENKWSQDLADLENIEFTIQNFEKAKVTAVESQINGLFQFVKFKLFDFQVNGAEVPVCEAQIGGVPYKDANTASKIVAGLDIIQTLSRFYEVSAPIFIDNRESAFNIQEIEGQVINLIAKEGLFQLTFK